MKIYIKNMVCNRCKMVVQSELEKVGLHPISVELGEVEIREEDIEDTKDILIENLLVLGFELLDDKRSKTIEKIKNVIVGLVHHHDNESRVNLSDYLSQQLSQDYSFLSHLFSEVEGRTIEKFYIIQKIERVKEFLMYDQLTLSEIADKLQYSSVAHLSTQFKKITGATPSAFKYSKNQHRNEIDDL
ncbi:AraC family transcriptional regulator [Pedobacter changchengzhani]|uniref:AraC family transcriptional regulator n=1 Tax=Pedobacter changchengzhani TaxID=2529274 RepID=A0A4R5MHH0_9SPHI|nr:AraC family transcriptional regulator [Pedobacter changchengzhani]TDG34921.1 AraC family transcriptional regulator [Pedobacter changchengzhani]